MIIFNNSYYPCGPAALRTEAIKPRSFTLLDINSASRGNSYELEEIDSFSLFKMERIMSFYLPLLFAVERSSTKVGIIRLLRIYYVRAK